MSPIEQDWRVFSNPLTDFENFSERITLGLQAYAEQINALFSGKLIEIDYRDAPQELVLPAIPMGQDFLQDWLSNEDFITLLRGRDAFYLSAPSVTGNEAAMYAPWAMHRSSDTSDASAASDTSDTSAALRSCRKVEFYFPACIPVAPNDPRGAAFPPRSRFRITLPDGQRGEFYRGPSTRGIVFTLRAGGEQITLARMSYQPWAAPVVRAVLQRLKETWPQLALDAALHKLDPASETVAPPAEQADLATKSVRGRKPVSVAERNAIVGRWQKAQFETTQADFCNREGISPATLRRWLTDMRAHVSEL